MSQETLNNLFTPLTREQRQLEAIKKWIKAKGAATIVAATGVGKTYIALQVIKKLITKYPNFRTIVVVPTDALRKQWEELVNNWELSGVEVKVMMGTSKLHLECDLLTIDEAHRINSEVLSNILLNTKYKFILGLTATFERLDGRHEILAKYAPVCDTITMQDALLNGWVSRYKDYVVLIDVPDIDVYKKYNTEFVKHFEYFNYDFNLIMSLLGPKGFINRAKYRDQICKDPSMSKEVFKQITYHATAFMRCLQARKKFIHNHPEKLRIAKEIIKRRPNSKIITFSANVAMAEAFKDGYVYTGKEGKKKNRMTLEEFRTLPAGVLHSCKLAEEGISLPDLSVGIMLGVNSSKTKQVQTLGRIVRLSKGTKVAEFFTLVINDTIETEWMLKSRSDGNFTIIDEENLYKVLDGESYEPYKKKVQNFTYRF